MKKKYLILSLNNKGGIGKTLVASLIAQMLSQRGIKRQLVDGEVGHAKFTALHQTDEQVTYIGGDLHDKQARRQFDSFWATMEEHEVVVADLPGNSVDDFIAWFNDVEIADIAKADGVEIVIAVTVHCATESIDGLALLHGAIGDQVKWIVVRNQEKEGTGVYDNSKLRKKLLDAGIDEVELAELATLPKEAVAATGRNHSAALRLWESSLDSMDPAQRARIKLQVPRLRRWLNDVYAQFEACKCLRPLLEGKS